MPFQNIRADMMTRPPPTLWHATTDRQQAYPPVVGDINVDVAIIGGGFTGLSAAGKLAEAGRSVAVIEAASIGFGASGRNAGFVVPNFSKAAPDYVIEKLGAKRGNALLQLVARGGDRVFELARQGGLTQEAEQNGWLQPAHSPEMAEALRRRVTEWQALGRPVEWLDAAETQQRTGIALYHGALRDASGGMINPLSYVYALARRAEINGAHIYEQSPALSAERQQDIWSVRTAQGRIQARHVLLCTNAFEQGAAKTMGRTIIPLHVYQIATKPLEQSVVTRFSPRREPVSDSRTNIFTYRLDKDNRLISGGMAILPFNAEARMSKAIVERLAHELQLDQVPEVEFVWRGTAAITTDFLPHLYQFGPNYFGATSCNGRGVAMTTMLGETLADAVLGITAPEDLSIPLVAARAVTMRPLAKAVPSFVLLQAKIGERLTRKN
ncbi:FAD-binding oxidoreductase [Paraburkholderia aspalathi]|nr:FAD-binding oxidoreductase [Paraburkholderia aspalathi]